MSRYLSMAAIGLTAFGINLATAGTSEAQGPFGLQLSVGRGPFGAGINFGFPGCLPTPPVCGPTAPYIGPVAPYPPVTVFRPAPVFVNPGLNYVQPFSGPYHHRRGYYGPRLYGW